MLPRLRIPAGEVLMQEGESLDNCINHSEP
jgi:hypothetical protein